LRHDEIETTLAKAKAVRSHAEKIITKGKHGQVGDYKALHEKAKNGDKEAAKEVARVVHLRRQVSSYLYDKEVVRKVFDNIAPRYKDRQGGYTRIIKIGPRRGDNSEMAIIQLV
ncbi:MAG: 50S ribosomal protein L17, partial [Candidatus Obscuribacterales bacterium]|nr:50S ribosomal protein L17 [Candidatus Obscuribacterales bacterium]